MKANTKIQYAIGRWLVNKKAKELHAAIYSALSESIADLERQLAEAKAEARDARNHMIFQVIKARKAFNSYGSQGHACDCRNACQSIIHSAGAVVPDYEAELSALRSAIDAAMKGDK